MGIINKLYVVHAVPSKNVQFPIDEEARKNSLSQCNFGLPRKPPPGLPQASPDCQRPLALLANSVLRRLGQVGYVTTTLITTSAFVNWI